MDNVQKHYNCINTPSSRTFKGSGKFSFIVCHETGGIASSFYGVVCTDRVKRHVIVSDVSAGNMLPASDWMIGRDIDHTALNGRI
jgi:hypothetical protein